MRKTLKNLILAISTVFVFNIPAMAQSVISVYLDGQKMQFEQNPVIENSYTLVPMRDIFEALGAKVEWDGGTKSVVAEKDSKKMVIPVNKNIATINGEEYKLDAPARNINSRVLVPLRFVSEQLNVKVDWDGNTKTVTLKTKEEKEYEDFPEYPGMTDIRSFMGISNFEEIKKDDATIYALKSEFFKGEHLQLTFKYYEYLKANKGFKYKGKVSDEDLGEKCYQYKNDKYTLTICVKDGEYYCKVSNNK